MSPAPVIVTPTPAPLLEQLAPLVHGISGEQGVAFFIIAAIVLFLVAWRLGHSRQATEAF